MKSIGRELTVKGYKMMKEMDSNGNGKIEEDEVKIGEDSEGDDYNSNTCFKCIIINCNVAFACVFLGTPTRPGNLKQLKVVSLLLDSREIIFQVANVYYMIFIKVYEEK